LWTVQPNTGTKRPRSSPNKAIALKPNKSSKNNRENTKLSANSQTLADRRNRLPILVILTLLDKLTALKVILIKLRPGSRVRKQRLRAARSAHRKKREKNDARSSAPARYRTIITISGPSIRLTHAALYDLVRPGHKCKIIAVPRCVKETLSLTPLMHQDLKLRNRSQPSPIKKTTTVTKPGKKLENVLNPPLAKMPLLALK
jgi:hypothetical protein